MGAPSMPEEEVKKNAGKMRVRKGQSKNLSDPKVPRGTNQQVGVTMPKQNKSILGGSV